MACRTRSSNLHYILHLDIVQGLTSNQRRRRNLGGELASQWEFTIAPLVNSFDARAAMTEQVPTF